MRKTKLTPHFVSSLTPDIHLVFLPILTGISVLAMAGPPSLLVMISTLPPIISPGARDDLQPDPWAPACDGLSIKLL